MSARVTPEEIAGIRRLLKESPPGGLRPVEIPRAVLDRLAQALFDLADLQDAAGALLSNAQEVHVCHRCAKIATKRVWIKLGLNWFSCDDHVGDCHAQELPHAAPLRTLRKLLEGSR